MSEYAMAELERRLANAVRIGTITAVDPSAPRARVTFGGESQSGWIPFSVARAGAAVVWAPPVEGEQVLVASPGGDTAQAVIMGSLYSNAGRPGSDDGSVYRVDLPNGVVIEIDGGEVRITAPNNVIVVGDVIADGISLKNHVHGGVTSGGSTTAGPQ